MPTKPLPEHKRRRCAVACENCKRRKERCDGRAPCRRCIARHLTAQCRYTDSRSGPSPRRMSRTQLRSPPEPSMDSLLNSSASPVFNPAASNLPEWVTDILLESPSPSTVLDSVTDTETQRGEQAASQPKDHGPDPSNPSLLLHDQGDGIFFGDAANESLLQKICQIVGRTLGSHPLVIDPLRYHDRSMGSVPFSRTMVGSIDQPAKPSAAKAKSLVSWAMRGTAGLLGVFSEVKLQAEMARWLGQRDETTTALCFSVLAYGSLSCPEDEDAIAEGYFSYASHLSKFMSMEEPNLKSILCHYWLAFYQLSAGRRHAAYHTIGIACRAACAMGLYKEDQPPSLCGQSRWFRDRLWKSLRMFDVFISGSLGRPICTTATPDLKIEQGYSSRLDMTAILDTVFREFQDRSTISRAFIVNMTSKHRLWASRMLRGLEADGVMAAEVVDGRRCEPSVAFLAVQESYYWSIMLLTRPVLLELASTQAIRVGVGDNHCAYQRDPSPAPDSETALVYASVDSAIRVLRLHQSLLPKADLPTRLPFSVNAAFTAALTLTLAVFANLDGIFPLRQNLKIAEEFLQRLGKHDSVAEHYRRIAEQLQSTCEEYIEQRNNQILRNKDVLVGGLFGRLQDKLPSLGEKVKRMNAAWVDEPATDQDSLSQSATSSLFATRLTDEDLFGSGPAYFGLGPLDFPSAFTKQSELINEPYLGEISDAGSLDFLQL